MLIPKVLKVQIIKYKLQAIFMNKLILRPVDVKTEKAAKILMILNNAKTAQEIADTVELPNERDVGIKVAEKILEKRMELGAFASLEQIAKVPQVGPERFTAIVKSLSDRKGEAEYTIKGQVKSGSPIDFSKAQLVVHAWIGGKEVAKANVDETGGYSLDFKASDNPTTTELRILPVNIKQTSNVPQIVGSVNAMTYELSKEKKGYKAVQDMIIPGSILVAWATVTKTYHTHGTVYLAKFESGILHQILGTIANAKIEFYECTPWPILIYPPIIKETLLGSTFTDPDGKYTFDFNYTYMKNPPLWFSDTIPDLRAKIFQFDGTDWIKVFESEIDWDIEQDYDRDFFVDSTVALLTPVNPGYPSHGFQFYSVGLLPIDGSRISNGYAIADSLNDPERIRPIHHQPFGGELRIFGCFAKDQTVTKYKVQIAEITEDHVADYPDTYQPAATEWKDVTDKLYNNKYNDTTKLWEPDNDLGPDVNNFYTNIDNLPEIHQEMALKVTWHSWLVPNGYYALRIVGYDTNGVEVPDTNVEMPIMRIDNTLPDVHFDVSGSVDECGQLLLGPSRSIDFRVTIADDEGHILSYTLSGTRGRGINGEGAKPAGDSLSGGRPNPDVLCFTIDELKNFIVDVLPTELQSCPSVAYGFLLEVYGSATDCYWPYEQYVRKAVNLIVSEQP
jgi:hypothetical protein